MNINVNVITVGDGFLAVTNLGGITVKGELTESKSLAIRSLFSTLARSGGDSLIAIELSLSGQTLTEIAASNG